MISSKIVEITGSKPGPTLAVLAGVHGNEQAGVFALQQLIPKLSITRGKLYLAYANPLAIEADVRMINKNLNRCFVAGNNGTDPEDIRVRELMSILDKCDALLDLHMFYDEKGLPFAICEDNAVGIANIFDVDIISTNWTKTEPGGSDGYMYLKGKIGICLECGPIVKSKEYAPYARNAIMQFLKYFEMTSEQVMYSKTNKRLIVADKAIYKKTVDFELIKGYANFDRLKKGQLIAETKTKKYLANDNECIIFPHYNARINEEAYIIGLEESS
jgi:succinylglutamate desuccinylase